MNRSIFHIAGLLLIFTIFLARGAHSQADPADSAGATKRLEAAIDTAAIINRVSTLVEASRQLLDGGDAEQGFEKLLEAEKWNVRLPPLSETRLQFNLLFANTLANYKIYPLAAKYAKVVGEIVTAMDPKPSSRTYVSLGRIGTYYMLAESYDSAAYYYRQAIAEATHLPPTPWQAAAHNNMGMLFAAQSVPDSANWHYALALQLAVDSTGKEDPIAGSIRDNFAQLYTAIGDFEKALRTYRSNTSFYPSEKSYRWTQANVGVAKTLLKLGRPAEAEAVLVPLDGDKAHFVTDVRLDYLRTAAEVYSRLGQHARSSAFQKASAELLDSLRTESENRLIRSLSVMTDIQLREYRSELEQQTQMLQEQTASLEATRQEASSNRFLLLMAILIGIVLLGGLLLYIIRRGASQRRKSEVAKILQQLSDAELRNKELEQEQLEHSLDLKKRDLADFALYISDNREFVRQLLDRLKDIRNSPESEMGGGLRTLMLDLKNRLSVDEKMKVFQENVDDVNQEFYQKLKEKFPNLTKSEKEMCGLIRLNLSGKEIASLRNITPKAVKMGRYRLRKKLSLGPDDDIYAFLQRI